MNLVRILGVSGAVAAAVLASARHYSRKPSRTGGKEILMSVLADAWGMHGDYGAGWMVVMMIGMVVFWGAIIVAVVWLIRGGIERSVQKQEETALELLDRRFAEGQMTVEEYRERRAELTGNDSPRRAAAAH